MTEGLPAVVVVPNSIGILPFVKEVFPLQASFATEWFGNMSCVAASIPRPTRFCCYADRIILNAWHASACERKKKTEFLHFIYILRFLVCFSSVSLKMPETSTDKLQSWLSYVSYTWSDFCLFLLTTSPPNAAKTTSMTNSFIFTSWFRFSLLKYFCLMVESKKKHIRELEKKMAPRAPYMGFINRMGNNNFSSQDIFVLFCICAEKKKDMWRCQRESSWCSLYCKHHLYLYSECNINSG